MTTASMIFLLSLSKISVRDRAMTDSWTVHIGRKTKGQKEYEDTVARARRGDLKAQRICHERYGINLIMVKGKEKRLEEK